MAPAQPDRPPGWKPQHTAGVRVVPSSSPIRYYGVCNAGDFAAKDWHDDRAAAEADVAEHVAAFS